MSPEAPPETARVARGGHCGVPQVAVIGNGVEQTFCLYLQVRDARRCRPHGMGPPTLISFSKEVPSTGTPVTVAVGGAIVMSTNSHFDAVPLTRIVPVSGFTNSVLVIPSVTGHVEEFAVHLDWADALLAGAHAATNTLNSSSAQGTRAIGVMDPIVKKNLQENNSHLFD